MYEKEGKDTAERLWNETIEELNFAGVRDILSSISR
jgi:hypothetical protein